ncbi:MAG TPA: PAS domain S-box protein [Rhodocyclaceae bacterium]|nr:PAS domain S-box protein [Rhodocyclaceae bacterium]
MKATQKIIAPLIVVALLVVLVVAASFWAFKQTATAAEGRTQTYAVISDANALLSELKDAETGQRGYLLSGDDAFLEPYMLVRDKISSHLKELHARTTLPTARTHLETLRPLVDARMEILATLIEMRREQGVLSTQVLLGMREGRRIMDAIRGEMNAYILLEQGELADDDAQFQAKMRNLFVIIAAASAFILLFAMSIAQLIYREAQHRRKQQAHLETQHMLQVEEEMNRKLREANTTLQLSEEKLAVTLNSIGDAVMATDAEGFVTLLNPLAERLTGWTQEAAQGHSVDEVFNIIDMESRSPSTVLVRDTLTHGTIQGPTNHTTLIARDGAEYGIAHSYAPIRDRDGAVVGAVVVFRDVSSEFEAQAALRDSASLIQTILNTVVDGIITLQASDGIVATVNAAAERMFGYTGDELIGLNLETLIPDFDYHFPNGVFGNDGSGDAATGIGRAREVVGLRKDGRRFPMELAVSDMWLGGKRYLTAMLRDITARKEAEDALVKAGALQSAIFNSANFSSIATDAAGVIQVFNVGAERMLGYAAADVINKITPADLFDPQEIVARAGTLSADQSASIPPGFEALVFKASQGLEDIYELTHIRQDGSRFPAVVSVTALHDAQNSIIGYLLLGTDQTEHKAVEAEQQKLDQLLRDQHFYTRSLIESNIDPLMTTDPAGILTDVNRQMEALTGCTRDELIGTPFKNYFTDADRAEFAINQVLSEKTVTNFELTARSRDRHETVVSCNATTFYDRDRVLKGVFVAARDVTESKFLDSVLLEKNAELQTARAFADKANQAKSDFLSSMSHELRTPLNAILGFAQLMESGVPEPTASQKRNLEQILKAGWYLLELINEILDLALIESGKVTLSHEAVSLVEVILECRAMVEPQALKRGVVISFPRFGTPYFVSADRTRVKQVLINLLFNAIKYNVTGGAVAVECTPVSPTSIRISVRDTGAGLSPEQVAQLFQPFNRLGKESGTEEGTGIGLVVTKRLVELMGGRIGADSAVGVGSVFWLELTLAAAPQRTFADAEHDAFRTPLLADGTQQLTLLYVEDNPANLELVEQLVARRPDLRLLSAADGNLGVEFARDHLPQVILMDINLPGISGIEAMKILRADPLTAHIPIIALSANAVPRDIEAALEAGFFSYLTKPIKVGEFMETLDKALKFTSTRKNLADEEEELS